MRFLKRKISDRIQLRPPDSISAKENSMSRKGARRRMGTNRVMEPLIGSRKSSMILLKGNNN